MSKYTSKQSLAVRYTNGIKASSKTFANLRPDLTDSEISDFVINSPQLLGQIEVNRAEIVTRRPIV